MVGNGILEKEIERELNDINKTHGSSQPLSTSLNFSQHPSTPSTFPITLLPFQNQSIMPIVYRLGDVFVLPSKGPGETWGLAINEAMASCRPVIASDKCGGAIDLIINEHNGLIFKAGDEKDLLFKIEFMVNANNRVMRENALNHIMKFNYQKFILSLGKYLIENRVPPYYYTSLLLLNFPGSRIDAIFRYFTLHGSLPDVAGK